ncbi:alpha/beta hydrolase [Halobacillus yeomjeoni]|uniref:alpha/beta fold hydrolase n=1 Tax=Halobacillus yeomjeoni TaxID=311194 RepID=UPI001CD4D078|nr:alpha/beta hydrolase [Halobacillus yeomjeoni]MCA0983925.1 alpha/beta hydrolase [Halobacillus yeomjeoni]
MSLVTTTLLDTSKGIVEFSYRGVGPAVLLIKGGHSTRETEFSHSSLIYEGFSLLTVSRPGYDYTERSTGKTPVEFADTIIEVLDHLNIERVNVIAISTAGPTGLALAAFYPERVSKLIMEAAETTSRMDEEGNKLLSTPTERILLSSLRQLLKLFPDVAMKHLLNKWTTEDAEDYLEKLSPNDRRFIYDLLDTSRSGKGILPKGEQTDFDIGHLETPVLGMYSQKDKKVQYTHALLLKSLVPDCEIFEVDADSHLIWIGKDARQVWDKRLEFLTQ